MTRPVVAVLRPHETLSRYEMDYVRLLEDEFELRIVTTGRPALGSADIPAVRLEWPDRVTLGGRPRSLLNGFYSRVLGRRYHIPGLARALAGSAVVLASEAASECTYQAARLKDRIGFRLCLCASENQPILEKRSRDALERIRYSLARVDHAFCIPPQARDRLAEAGLDTARASVIGHGIDCERFSPAERKREPGEPFRAGYCGRFRSEKGLVHLVEAVRDLDVELHLLGEGPDEAALRAIATPRVVFHPPLPYPRIHEFYRTLDAFVLPSVPLPGLVEQFGFVLMEALASGLPVVASAIGGITGVLGDEALYVAPGRPDELRAALARLAEDGELRSRLAARGRERALRFYRRESVADAMRGVVRRLAPGGRNTPPGA